MKAPSGEIDVRAVSDAARNLLTLRGDGATRDLWLWDHTKRVLRLAQMIALLPEAAEFCNGKPDLTAVAIAALFHDAGWAVQVQGHEIDRWQVLSRPTNDLQRELGVGALQDLAAGLVPDEVIETAGQAIRGCNDRYTTLAEAHVLAEAENLDEIGLTYVLRQIRHIQAAGRPLGQLLVNWSRYVEYRYWDARINDCLRWETTRRIARQRLGATERFMTELASDREAADLHQVLESSDIDSSGIWTELG